MFICKSAIQLTVIKVSKLLKIKPHDVYIIIRSLKYRTVLQLICISAYNRTSVIKLCNTTVIGCLSDCLECINRLLFEYSVGGCSGSEV